MIITRWQAPTLPSPEQIKMLLELEGLETFTEEFNPQVKINDHRHPFTEVRYIVSGEMMFSISGNQFLLRAGDRVEIPANTKHWHIAQGNTVCQCICAHRVF